MRLFTALYGKSLGVFLNINVPTHFLFEVYREYYEEIHVFSFSAQKSAHFFVFESYRANLASFSARVTLLTHESPIFGFEVPNVIMDVGEPVSFIVASDRQRRHET